ncbi:Ribosomal RNA large subunit methyltransferase H [Sinobacterium norvegicum]|uniref:Ribosomal RNA large subunit methyltransferase H n=1 Tax=Sinobacterium norvegicum TaxID=1641715 RepID=A0ABM9AGU0_9GAMM|nr:23S rRNA (pseudouridine(1915)-N(3))-methyltransferase RlmH [Sinobacterium norvegicum]CAH0992432.1 Ribosomal RNA large subunit methyltransferase H [Sinobacterium norvegicum]
MRIRIIAVGSKMPKWVDEGVNEYLKRLPATFKVEFVEIPLGKRGKGADVKRAIASESTNMLAQVPASSRVVALDVLGKSWSTEKLADYMADWQMTSPDVCLLIGGPDGLSSECLQRADQKWSLSALTMPHPLVRVLLAEQIYRGWTINQNHPYHRS